jgi:hypothetical protein
MELEAAQAATYKKEAEQKRNIEFEETITLLIGIFLSVCIIVCTVLVVVLHMNL